MERLPVIPAWLSVSIIRSRAGRTGLVLPELIQRRHPQRLSTQMLGHKASPPTRITAS